MDYQKGVRALPERMQEPVLAWIEKGRMPGSFLRSVLENDFMAAVVRADDENADRLRDYACFLYHDAPSECFGSPALVVRWRDLGGLDGIEAAAASMIATPPHQPLDI